MSELKTPALTDEQKAAQIQRVLMQKRESFAQGILFNLCNGSAVTTKQGGKKMVEIAVSMADQLISTLYPVVEE